MGTSRPCGRCTWPGLYGWSPNGDKHPDSDALPDAESMLRWCVPVSGQPYGSLKALTITAKGAMECEIPNAMPNLEELVIFASGVARVHLDDPVATLSPLKTLHLFGQPMMPKIHNIHLAQVSASLASRGLAPKLCHVSASTWEAFGVYQRIHRAMQLMFVREANHSTGYSHQRAPL